MCWVPSRSAMPRGICHTASLIIILTCLLPGLCSALTISGLLSSISNIVFSELMKGPQPVSGIAGSSLTSRVILWPHPATLPGIYAQGMNSKPGDLPSCTTSLPQSWPPKGVEGSPLPSTTSSHSLSPSHSFGLSATRIFHLLSTMDLQSENPISAMDCGQVVSEKFSSPTLLSQAPPSSLAPQNEDRT